MAMFQFGKRILKESNVSSTSDLGRTEELTKLGVTFFHAKSRYNVPVQMILKALT